MGKARKLGEWFERQKRVLPWRDEPSIYRVWVSEIMLQQTQVVTVVPYFERFVKRFPTVETLAAAPLDDVLLFWAGLGYYSRARNLHRGAQLITAAGGVFPRDREGWLEVPGVGEYTAGAILSIALNLPEAILDGNVERVLSRVHRVGRPDGDAAYKVALWRHAREWVSEGVREAQPPSRVNQALMELGATVCGPRAPRCKECPVARACGARKAEAQAEYPPKKKRKEWVQVEESVHCVLDADGRALLRRRAAGEWRAGLWDFLEEKPPASAKLLASIESKHVVTRHKISRTTHVWRVSASRTMRAGERSADLRWISLTEPEVAVGSALKKVLEEVRRVGG